MKLNIKKIISDREIVHFANSNILVTSFFDKIFVRMNDSEYCITIPSKAWKKVMGKFRLSRRALRLDKCNVLPVGNNYEHLVIIRQGRVFHYSEKNKILNETLRLRYCCNVLHQSIAVTENKNLFFGEYGSQ